MLIAMLGWSACTSPTRVVVGLSYLARVLCLRVPGALVSLPPAIIESTNAPQPVLIGCVECLPVRWPRAGDLRVRRIQLARRQVRSRSQLGCDVHGSDYERSTFVPARSARCGADRGRRSHIDRHVARAEEVNRSTSHCRANSANNFSNRGSLRSGSQCGSDFNWP